MNHFTYICNEQQSNTSCAHFNREHEYQFIKKNKNSVRNVMLILA